MRVTRAPLSTRNIIVMGPAVRHDRSRTYNPSNTPAIVITFPSSLGGLVRHHSTYYVARMADRVHQRTWTGRFGTRRRGAGRRPILGLRREIAAGPGWARRPRLRFRPGRRVQRRCARRIAPV